jgi:protein disulfide-isomerase
VVHVNRNKNKNQDVDDRYGNPSKHGYPVLVLVDATGNLLHVQDTGELELKAEKRHDPKKVLAVLRDWAPGSAKAALPFDEKADARQELAAAKTKAASDGKLLLIHFGRNESAWCRRLEQLFRADPAIAALLKERYVIVRVDRKTDEKNRELDEAFGKPSLLGFPALVVADATGKALRTEGTAEFEGEDAYDAAALLKALKEWGTAPAK